MGNQQMQHPVGVVDAIMGPRVAASKKSTAPFANTAALWNFVAMPLFLLAVLVSVALSTTN